MTRETVIIMTWSSDLLFISDLIVDHYNLILASSVTFHFRTSHIDSVSAQVGAASLGELVSASPLTVQEVRGFVWAFSGFFSNTGQFKTICMIIIIIYNWLYMYVAWYNTSRTESEKPCLTSKLCRLSKVKSPEQKCRSTSATTSSAIVGL